MTTSFPLETAFKLMDEASAVMAECQRQGIYMGGCDDLTMRYGQLTHQASEEAAKHGVSEMRFLQLWRESSSYK